MQKRTTLAILVTALGLAPAALANNQVRLTAELGKPVVSADQRATNYLKIGVTGFERTESGRTPVNLAVVLDRSSSMSGAKFAAAKEAAYTVLERLDSNDIISIVTYDSTVEVLVPATKVTDRDLIVNKIRALRPRGSTALFAGVSRGIEEVRKFNDDGRVNRVILLSDGQANIGPSSPNELGRLGAAAGKEGIAITTIGLGLGYNEDLMVQLAQKSDGNHAFAEDGEKLVQIFKYELGDVLSVVAQELSMTVKLADGVRAVRLLNRDGEIHGQEVVLSLNQLYQKQEKYFLIEVEMSPRGHGVHMNVADVRLSYSNMITKNTDRVNASTGVAFDRSPKVVAAKENREVMVAAVEMLAVAQNRAAVALRDQGKQQEAERLLMDNAGYLEQNARRYGSTRLGKFGKKNKDDAKKLDKDNWNRQRKSMRKLQYEFESQQSY